MAGQTGSMHASAHEQQAEGHELVVAAQVWEVWEATAAEATAAPQVNVAGQ